MEWYFEKEKWLGFDDGVFTYRVAQDGNGWYFEHIHDLDGMDGYNTAEEAKLAAEKDLASHASDFLEEEPFFSQEELEEIFCDLAFEEARERKHGLID